MGYSEKQFQKHKGLRSLDAAIKDGDRDLYILALKKMLKAKGIDISDSQPEAEEEVKKLHLYLVK